MYPVSITSQGQISIPIPIRRLLGLNSKTKAFASVKDGTVVIEPAKDLLDYVGSLNKYALKGKTIDEIIALEKKAVGDAVVERYLKKQKRSGTKLLII